MPGTAQLCFHLPKQMSIHPGCNGGEVKGSEQDQGTLRLAGQVWR